LTPKNDLKNTVYVCQIPTRHEIAGLVGWLRCMGTVWV